ncbi:LysR family transcriptional regulator, partial [Nonomuraea sp. RK-328]|nr:LysR family transcriptional regulator [Nonomuraea sp. RK-328]
VQVGERGQRDPQGVRLTPVGAALLPHARRVLAAWDESWEAVVRARSEQRATLVVGMSTSPGRGGLLPAIRSRFTALHPGAAVRLRQVGWEDATAGLADGSADVAFVWLPFPDPGRYAWTVVAEEPRLVDGRGVCLLAGGNAPLLTLGGVVTRPVRGLSPSRLALAWRAGGRRPLVLGYVRACRQATGGLPA